MVKGLIICDMKTNIVKTERLRLHTSSLEEMTEFTDLQTDAVLKAAYTEMLEGAVKHPDQWEWHALWMIELTDGKHIGELCFKGLNADGSVELGCGISAEYQGHGYGSEAVRAAAEWALISHVYPVSQQKQRLIISRHSE